MVAGLRLKQTYPVLQVAVFELHIGDVARTLDESVPSGRRREADLSFGNF